MSTKRVTQEIVNTEVKFTVFRRVTQFIVNVEVAPSSVTFGNFSLMPQSG